MNAIEKLNATPGFKRFMTVLYGLGAAIVILGALFKIQHYPGASLMLMIGMGTEAVIFFFSAFETPHVEPDWSLVFPELSEQFHGVASTQKTNFGSITAGNGNMQNNMPVNTTAAQELDTLLQKANISDEVLKSLGDGFTKLNDTVSSLNDITAIGANSKMLSESLKKAGRSTEDYSDSMNSINASYDSIVKKLSEQANSNASAQESLNSAMSQFVKSLEATAKMNKQFQEESSKLVENIAELNKVYSNMLNAFNVNKK